MAQAILAADGKQQQNKCLSRHHGSQYIQHHEYTNTGSHAVDLRTWEILSDPSWRQKYICKMKKKKMKISYAYISRENPHKKVKIAHLSLKMLARWLKARCMWHEY